MHYYEGVFHISGVTYNDTCDSAASQASTNLSKDIETKVNQNCFISVFVNLAEVHMGLFLFSLDRCQMHFKILVFTKNMLTLRSSKLCKYKLIENLMEKRI